MRPPRRLDAHALVLLLCLLARGLETSVLVRWCYLSDNPQWRRISDDPSQTFAVECTDACLQKVDSPLWGTRVYTYDSNICRAAMHDGRLSRRSLAVNREVRVQRQPDPRSYLGSVRFGVSSESYGQLSLDFGAFHFTSPRAIEEVQDVTALTRPAAFGEQDDVRIECHHRQLSRGDSDPCHVTFGRQTNVHYSSGFGDALHLPAKAKIHAPKGPRAWAELVLPPSAMQRTGAYWCGCDQSSLSRVVSLVMRNDAHLAPEAMTKIVSVGDTDVTLSVSVHHSPKKSRSRVRWAKDGEDLRVSTPQLLIAKVRLGHAGVYSTLDTSNNDDDQEQLERRALMRLIVRVCPDGVFGPSCDRRCSICLNGGVCHDLTGECLCPPGFRGPACDTPCGPNRFGRECSSRCDVDGEASSAGCRGILFCLPDPFGCSCASGYTGLNCNTSCRSGTFGAGCTQHCGHCIEGTSCDRFTGICPNGCQMGWRGPSCTVALPYLRNPPTLLEATSSSLSVAWSAWDPATDPGDGQAVAYILQYKEKHALTWEEISLPGHVPHGTTNFTIKPLKPEKDYHVRVLVVDQSGGIFKEEASYAIYNTVCEGPLEPPPNITVLAIQPRQLLITWQVPPTSAWRCQDVTFTLRYHSNDDSNDVTTRITDLNTTRYIIESLPYMDWIIQLRTENLAGASQWSEEVIGRTGQDAPGPVRNMQLGSRGGIVVISWEIPAILNGKISQFEIGSQLTERRACIGHNVEDIVQSEVISLVNTTEFSAALPMLEGYSEYLIAVRAWTVLPGPYVDGVIVTPHSVPTGGATNLQLWYSQPTELGFTWDRPPCQLTHGQTTAYLCIIKGTDPWLQGYEQRYIVEHKHVKHGSFGNFYPRVAAGNQSADGTIRIKFLKPYSTYILRVHAGTSTGFGNASAAITAKTEPDVPPPPSNLSMYAKSWTFIALQWSPPYPPYGEAELFQLQLEPCPRSACNITLQAKRAACLHPLRQGKYCYTWDGLIPNQTYSSWVSAKNKGVEFFGDSSDAITIETVESIPGPPAFIQFWNVATKSLIIKWGQPLVTEGIITHYRVNLSSVEPSVGGSTLRLLQTLQVLPGSSNLEFAVEGLQPNTKYRASVEACSAIGCGDASWHEVVTSRPHKASGSYSSDTGQQRHPGNNPHHHYGYKDDRAEADEGFSESADSDTILAAIIGTAASILILLALMVVVLYIVKWKSRQRLVGEEQAATVQRSASANSILTLKGLDKHSTSANLKESVM